MSSLSSNKENIDPKEDIIPSLDSVTVESCTCSDCNIPSDINIDPSLENTQDFIDYVVTKVHKKNKINK